MAMSAKKEIVDNRRVLEELDVLKGAGYAQLSHNMWTNLCDIFIF
jgi:hypothetical protein